jgi:hypothetical protein
MWIIKKITYTGTVVYCETWYTSDSDIIGIQQYLYGFCLIANNVFIAQ